MYLWFVISFFVKVLCYHKFGIVQLLRALPFLVPDHALYHPLFLLCSASISRQHPHSAGVECRGTCQGCPHCRYVMLGHHEPPPQFSAASSSGSLPWCACLVAHINKLCDVYTKTVWCSLRAGIKMIVELCESNNLSGKLCKLNLVMAFGITLWWYDFARVEFICSGQFFVAWWLHEASSYVSPKGFRCSKTC